MEDAHAWRHNCALKALERGIKNHLDPDMDLPGLQAAENQLVMMYGDRHFLKLRIYTYRHNFHISLQL